MRIGVRGWLGWACAAALVAIVAAAVTAREPDAEATRAIMGEVFAALRTVLPASLEAERFADPARRAEIGRALDTLARNGERLEAHGSRADQGFAFLSRSLARDARDVERRFDAGHSEEARFLLHGITETCATCHSRLPDPEDSALTERFLDDAALASLTVPERATWAMATRQFDEALEAQELLLSNPEHDAASIEILGHLEEYLEVCLRVKGDAARPAQALAAFAQREDVRPGLRDTLARWISDLRALEEGGPVEGLAPARALVQRAEVAAVRNGERAELVRYVAASSALHRYVAGLEAGHTRAAEAYYWLGVIESRIGRSFWLSQTEAYLEAAIRLDPAGPHAPDAYAVLEEYVVLGYTGSSGEHVPPDVRGWLDELSRLIVKAREEHEA